MEERGKKNTSSLSLSTMSYHNQTVSKHLCDIWRAKPIPTLADFRVRVSYAHERRSRGLGYPIFRLPSPSSSTITSSHAVSDVTSNNSGTFHVNPTSVCSSFSSLDQFRQIYGQSLEKYPQHNPEYPLPSVNLSYGPKRKTDSSGKKLLHARERQLGYTHEGNTAGNRDIKSEHVVVHENGYMKLKLKTVRNSPGATAISDSTALSHACKVGWCRRREEIGYGLVSDQRSLDYGISCFAPNTVSCSVTACSSVDREVLSVAERVEIELEKSLKCSDAESKIVDSECDVDTTTVPRKNRDTRSPIDVEMLDASGEESVCEECENVDLSTVLPADDKDPRSRMTYSGGSALETDTTCKDVGHLKISAAASADNMTQHKETYENFFSNIPLTVAQRIEMELRDGSNRDCESNKDRPNAGKKKKKKEDSSKIDQPASKPAILTFTTEILYQFLIAEVGNEFTCQNCKMVFLSKYDAERHVDVHSPYRCLSCSLIFSNVRDLKSHYRGFHKELLHCTHCTYSTSMRHEFDRHLKSKHKHSRTANFFQIVCYICGVLFPVWEPLDEHMEKEHGIERTVMEGDFQCPLCNAIQRSMEGFRDHVRKHRGEYFRCPHPTCKYKSANKTLLNNHYNAIHLGSRKFSCPYEECSSKFKNNNQVKEHVNVVHDKIRKYICETCGKGFLAKKHLSVHERIHSDFKPVGCKYCNYRCRQSASLKWHMKQSHPELQDSAPATSEDHYVKHTLKRGRKATRRKLVSVTTN